MADNDNDSKGVRVDLKGVSFLIALFTLSSIMVGAVTWINSYAFRIELLESKNAQLVGQITQLSGDIDKLNETIVKLTIELNRINDRVTR